LRFAPARDILGAAKAREAAVSDGRKVIDEVALAPVVFAIVYPLGTGLFVLTAVAAAGCGLRIRHRSRERRP